METYATLNPQLLVSPLFEDICSNNIQEMISVCMATYNGEKYIEQQLESILSQLQDEDELIITDDGSTDDTLRILKGIQQGNVKVFENHFRNPVLNFEFALRQSSKPLVCFSDQDDIWLPCKRQVIMDNLKGENLQVLLMNGQIIDENGEDTGKTTFEKWRTRTGFYNNLKRNTYMGSSMAFTADLRKYIMPFPKDIPMHDWWIGLIAEKVGTVKITMEKTIKYRIHGNNRSLRGSTWRQKIVWRRNMLQLVNRRIREGKKS